MKGITDPDWWKETTVYQIYPRSFQDSNNDGIGDLPGIISRLDYIGELGFETIWISPFFASPQEDFGYDISDYRSIAREYGTMEDCERLIEEVHRRGMKIVLDMVLNHTSDKHPWFVESSSSRDNPKRDWYVWRDGKKGHKPPNNWLSKVGGSGWHYSEETDQWYWAAFLPFQPDLNYRNREVKEAMFDTLRFWLDKGVDGFRLDIIGSIYEDELFRDNPFSFRLMPTEDSTDRFFRSSVMVENLPETINFAKELRQVLDEYHGRFLLGETFGTMHNLRDFTGRDKPDGLHTAFIFKSLFTPMKARPLRKLITEMEHVFPSPWIPTWVFANHDRMRRITRHKGNEDLLRLQVLLQHTARGIPITYQGEEIAMRQAPIKARDSLDPVARAYAKFPEPLFKFANHVVGGGINRDGCRTPMQWDDGLNAGFSRAASTWLPINRDFAYCNVASQLNDGDSILNLYRRLLKLRREEDSLRSGGISICEGKNKRTLLVYDRTGQDGSLRIFFNFSKRKIPLKEEMTGELLLSTDLSDREKVDLHYLAPFEGRIYRL